MPRLHSRLFKFWIPLTILLIAFPHDAPADNHASGIKRMVSQIETLFPTLEGYVLSVEGDRLAIDLKRGQAVSPGQTLNLIRYGETLTHPVTQKIIGRKETDLGQIKVLEVRKDYSIAQVITPGVKAHKGDGVRSLFKKVKLLVAPVQADAGVTGNPQALGLEIEAQLNRHVRFEVPAFDLGVWLLENEVSLSALTRPENLARLRKDVAADSILLTRVRSIKGKTVLNYRLASTSDGRALKEARVLIPALPAAQSPVKEQKDPAGIPKERGPLQFISKQEFDFQMVDFAVGDLTGNGEKDFVIIDDHQVMIYRYENQEFRKVGQLKAKKNINRFLSVDVADINGNGRDEIFITNPWGDRLKSFVLEAVPGKKGLTPIWEDVNRYFRVLRDFDGTPILVSQRPAFERPFRPGIQAIHYKNGNYEVGEELPLQSGDFRNLTLYGLAFGHIRLAQSRETIFLDNNYKLRVYSSRGQILASSDEYFGSDPRLIEVGVKDNLAMVRNNPEESQPVRFRGRIELVQYGARKFLLLPKNHRTGGTLMESMVIIKNSSLVFFEASEEGLAKVHETKKLSGYLAAFQVVDAG
ncbi:MAG: VCBS repeat-containing protein, partial [Nitrospinaceae bacterium]